MSVANDQQAIGTLLGRPKVTLITVQSLNGYIAMEKMDNLAWGSKEDKAHFRETSKRLHYCLTGSATFDTMMEDKGYNWDGDTRFWLVMTSNPQRYAHFHRPEKVQFFSGSPMEALRALEARGAREVALTGGGKLNSSFLAEKLIDEALITIAPCLLPSTSQAVKNFDAIPSPTNLRLLSFTPLGPGELLLHYSFVY
eukprot:TRINITY_DN26162_c0_g1_i1.p1 TRINITY_DN26162_c0_g1~~TRINITY_DN26162_c0_g1_i1.p1  ORF type:complete len:197 (+),score=41.45 TRINITY_DN26162_c0_g1_i1:78-668(+)